MIEISETAEVVDLKRTILGAAVLACLRKKALDDLAADAVVDRRWAIKQDCILLPCQRDAAECGYQWLSAFTSFPCDG